MSKKNLLFIAYLYPPAGGKALPGVQRTVKFVRYLDRFSPWVLTLHPDRYPDFFTTDNATPLPVAGEKIEYAGTFDLFSVLLRLREMLRPSRNGPSSAADSAPSLPSRNAPAREAAGRFQEIKDLVSGLLRFPDYAHPWIFPAIAKGRELIRRHDIDAIFATGMPWTSLTVGWCLKKLTGAKLMVDFRDPWVGNLFASPKPRLVQRMESGLERRIVSDADLVSLNTDPLREEFIERYPHVSPERFVTLPNGFDDHDFVDIPELDAPGTAKGEGPGLTVSHAGFLYGMRDPRPLLEAVDLIRRETPEIAERIRFEQMGDIQLGYDPHQWAAERNLSDQFLDRGSLPYRECLRRMAGSDILLIIQQDTLTQIPSKLYEYIYLNKPILTIASRAGALGRAVEAYGFGEIFTPDEVSGISNYLRRMWRTKAENGRLKAAYPHRTRFDVRRITEELENSLQSIG